MAGGPGTAYWPCCGGIPDLTQGLDTTPLNSFEEIRSEWLDLLEECPVNTFYLMPQWQENLVGGLPRQPRNGRILP